MYLFKSAYDRQFYRGRTLESVAIVCLYLAIRQCSTRDRYALMLIDFAELSQGGYNVFELGKMAKVLQQMLYLDASRERWWNLEKLKAGAATEAQKAAWSTEQDNLYKGKDMLSLQDPEDLIERFCDKLDFGELTNAVKRDAAKIAQSMNRDWMVTGRRPAGIAGAAVIIAARMNNFRRTLREVVLVAKVTEITLSKRIEEFKETKSSTMSVRDFRSTDPSSVQGADVQNPPSYYRALPEWQEKQAKRKRKRGKKNGALPESAAAIENDIDEQIETENEGGSANENEDENGEIGEEQPPNKRPRLDADGFVVPELPSRSQNENTPRRKVGKPKGSKNWAPRPLTAEEEQEERELESEIQEQLSINASLDPTRSIQEGLDSAARIEVSDMPSPPNRNAIGPFVNSTTGNIGGVSMEETLGHDEFDDDPDVANCLLNEQERIFKETVWVEENKDWLRTEHAKKVKRELKDRELREKGIDPEKERMKKLRRKDGMQRAGRAGDISYLEEARNRIRDGNGGQIQAERGADVVDDEELDEEGRRNVSIEARGSVQVMMQQRGTFSRRVDYSKLSQAYVLPGFEDSSESRSESPASNSFYRPHQSRGHATSNIRRAKATAQRIAGMYDTEDETEVDQSSQPGPSKACRPSQLPQNANEDEEQDGEHEEDTGTPEAAVQRKQTGRPQQLPTPSSTQTQLPRASPMVVDDREDSESPLSSTHTPVGYASGAPGSPQATQPQRRQPEEVEEAESSGDEDDYINDDDEDADPGDDLDKIFGAGETYAGEEEEVVDE